MRAILWTPTVARFPAKFRIGSFFRNRCEKNFVILWNKKHTRPKFRVVSSSHFHKTKRNDTKCYSWTKPAKTITSIRQLTFYLLNYKMSAYPCMYVPVPCLLNCMMSPCIMICYLHDFIPPVWCLLNCIMSAKLYHVCSNIWCLPTCIISALLGDVCLSVFLTTYLYDGCSTI